MKERKIELKNWFMKKTGLPKYLYCEILEERDLSIKVLYDDKSFFIPRKAIISSGALTYRNGW